MELLGGNIKYLHIYKEINLTVKRMHCRNQKFQLTPEFVFCQCSLSLGTLISRNSNCFCNEANCNKKNSPTNYQTPQIRKFEIENRKLEYSLKFASNNTQNTFLGFSRAFSKIHQSFENS